MIRMRNEVTLLVCSNNINTQISTSKLIIQVLAIIAEVAKHRPAFLLNVWQREVEKISVPSAFSSLCRKKKRLYWKSTVHLGRHTPFCRQRTSSMRIWNETWREVYPSPPSGWYCGIRSTVWQMNIPATTFWSMTETYLENRPTLMVSMGPAAYNKTDQMKAEDEDSTFFNSKFSRFLPGNPLMDCFCGPP